MRRRRGVSIVLSLAVLGACGDLLHGTDWKTVCESDPTHEGCAADAGAGGQGGTAASSGGSSASATGGGAPLGYGDVCASYAASYCTRLAECRPLLYALIGGAQACPKVLTDGCTKGWSGTGIAMTPDSLASCVAAMGFDGAACSTIVRLSAGQFVPTGCLVAGTRDDGAACTDIHQCKGLGCRFDGASACGVCFTARKLGETCEADAPCGSGLLCAAGTCVALGDVGASCTTADQCFVDLYCDGTHCAARTALGAACDPMAPHCDNDSYCGAMSTCTAYAFANAGGACGSLAEYTGCPYGSFCAAAMSTDTTGTCTAQGTDGEPCPTATTLFAGACAPPSTCLGGKCIVPDGSQCP